VLLPAEQKRASALRHRCRLLCSPNCGAAMLGVVSEARSDRAEALNGRGRSRCPPPAGLRPDQAAPAVQAAARA
jgi:hypothetical protein